MPPVLGSVVGVLGVVVGTPGVPVELGEEDRGVGVGEATTVVESGLEAADESGVGEAEKVDAEPGSTGLMLRIPPLTSRQYGLSPSMRLMRSL